MHKSTSMILEICIWKSEQTRTKELPANMFYDLLGVLELSLVVWLKLLWNISSSTFQWSDSSETCWIFQGKDFQKYPPNILNPPNKSFPYRFSLCRPPYGVGRHVQKSDWTPTTYQKENKTVKNTTLNINFLKYVFSDFWTLADGIACFWPEIRSPLEKLYILPAGNV